MIYAVEALNFIQFLDKKGALYNKTFAKTVRHRATRSAAPCARRRRPVPHPPRAAPHPRSQKSQGDSSGSMASRAFA